MRTVPPPRVIRSIVTAAALVGVASASTATATAPVRSEPATMRTLAITRQGVTLRLGYCGTGSLDERQPGVTDVVLVVHGDGRTACGYANAVREAAARAGRLHRTLVVAPHFPISTDAQAGEPGRLYWASAGWKSGADSRTAPHARAWAMSSYAALDLLAERTTRRGLLPDVATVSVVGHSGGGQFVNRYLATTPLPATPTREVQRRWIIASPSSYLYLDPHRIKDSGRPGRLTDAQRAACPGFDTFRYGLRDRSGYPARPTVAQIRDRMARTPVTYLVGGADDDPGDPSMDRSCEASWQGSQRVARARNYQRHLDDVLGRGVSSLHPLVVIPGVGHSAKAVLTSGEAVRALFPPAPNARVTPLIDW